MLVYEWCVSHFALHTEGVITIPWLVRLISHFPLYAEGFCYHSMDGAFRAKCCALVRPVS